MTRARRFALVLAIAVGVPVCAVAQTLPSRFAVHGVSPGDTLNVRATPSASAPVIATLAPDATGIEVVERDASGSWGAINAGEASGWVSLRFLTEEPEVWQAGALPSGLRCLGTEPFWSLTPDGTTAQLDTPEASRTLNLTTLDLGSEADPRRALVLDAGAVTATATITPKACGDGMPDRRFGLETLVVMKDGETARLLSGCCTIAPAR